MTEIEVVLYSRPDCCLCHEALEILERVRRSKPFRLVERNIDDSPELTTLYGAEIPVVTVNGRSHAGVIGKPKS